MPKIAKCCVNKTIAPNLENNMTSSLFAKVEYEFLSYWVRYPFLKLNPKTKIKNFDEAGAVVE